MSKWFNETFLPSLFEQCKKAGNSQKWLSQKQTAICTDYMEKEIISFSDGFGSYHRIIYHYFWNDRKISLAYSKKNGCAVISFSPTKEEQKQAEAARKEERKAIQKSRIERIKSKPERLERELLRLKKELIRIEGNIIIYKNLVAANEADELDQEAYEDDLNRIKEIEKKINELK